MGMSDGHVGRGLPAMGEKDPVPRQCVGCQNKAQGSSPPSKTVSSSFRASWMEERGEIRALSLSCQHPKSTSLLAWPSGPISKSIQGCCHPSLLQDGVGLANQLFSSLSPTRWPSLCLGFPDKSLIFLVGFSVFSLKLGELWLSCTSTFIDHLTLCDF